MRPAAEVHDSAISDLADEFAEIVTTQAMIDHAESPPSTTSDAPVT